MPPRPPRKKSEEAEANTVSAADETSIYPDPESAARGDTPMTVVEHLDEFRSRLITCLVTLLVFIGAALVFSDETLRIATYPFAGTGMQLNIFTLTGGFMVRLKIAGVAGLTMGLPVVLAQIWRFSVPAIERENRLFFRAATIASILLFYAGLFFVYFVIAPVLIRTLLGYITPGMTTMIGVDEYLLFILFMGVSLGLVFELPIVIMTLSRLGIVTPVFLLQKRKYAYIIIWIVAALITPQDILAQILVAIPLMFLYEVSIIISRFMIIRMKKRELRRLTR